MAILRKDLPEMNKGAQSLRDLIVGHQQKMDEQQNQADVDVGKAGQMLPIEAQKGHNEADNKLYQNKGEIAQGIQGVKDMQDQGLVNEGGGATAKGVSISKGYDPNKTARAGQVQTQHDMSALDKSPAAKDMANLKTQLQTVSYMHDLLDDPNKMDEGTFMALKAQAALGGSGSRAIGQVMHALGGNDHSLSGTFEDFKNQVTGSANTTRTAAQLNAARDSAFKYGDELEGRYGSASAQLEAQAPRYAPSLFSAGTLPAELTARKTPMEASLASLRARKQKYLSQTQQANVPNTLGAPAAAYAQPQGPVDKLAALLGGGQKPSQAAPKQDPPAMSFEEFKKRKASGQL